MTTKDQSAAKQPRTRTHELTIIVALLISAAAVSAENSSRETERDAAKPSAAMFLQDAAQGSAAEVEMGEMAKAKGQSSEVKAFGQRLVTDHTKAREKALQIAATKGLTIDAQPNAGHKKHAAKLSALSGNEFDREFMSSMVTDHRKDVDKFKAASQDVKDDAVVGFAKETLPTLQDHLQRAIALNDTVQK